MKGISMSINSEDYKNLGFKMFSLYNNIQESPYLSIKPFPKRKKHLLIRSSEKSKKPSSSYHQYSKSSIHSPKKSQVTQEQDISLNKKMTPDPYSTDIKNTSAHHRNSNAQIRKSQEKPVLLNLEDFHNKLNVLEKSSVSLSLYKYFEIFDEIISKDYVFGNVLKRIKNALMEMKTIIDQSNEYIQSLELKIAEKQSTITQMLIGKADDFSKTQNNTSTYKISDFEDPVLDHYLEDPEESKVMKDEIEKLNNQIKDMQKDAEVMIEKEKKYASLISALRDRGYPIEEVYIKDVYWSLGGTKEGHFSGHFSQTYNENCDKYTQSIRLKSGNSFNQILSSDESIPDAFN
ncbi:hypothetical protein SteCoe_21621 [Stentor coeruleus]|uniref:Translin-associated factor X-interacting protein 1 N-terminal domain-containing protein n=1 Tax=Stentor coeruleus TaxID=5963 RepID=A0A1R2BP14_9CILI|nr:hypothetical protein SteCoe_21621 [Stentor coeruleus]